MMSARDVLQVLGLLEAAGVTVWLDGGWGVDALLGEQTRPHDDLDLAVSAADLDLFNEVMRANGFTMFREDSAFNFVLADPSDRRVDAHLVDLATTTADGFHGPAGLAYPVGSLDGTGTILGQRVACCTAEFQVISHTGYEIDDDDVRDVMALHHRFGIPVPPSIQAGPTGRA
ncbi:nucleotidyltransferase domain-containing protein [Nonomuraea sp. NPDC050556]|uniref:nucleotidyltransferase domain-containing protein n=1 Tax=Nonomuraea sp. NPDC050556 TaxID=3364369 RepID=UPI00378BB7F2